MNNLPYELYSFIFEGIGIKDLINLRLVCKWLKYVVDNYHINELVISTDISDRFDKWFYRNRVINYNCFILLDLESVNDFKIFKRKIVELSLLNNIKLLKLFHVIQTHNYCLSSYYLNKFVKLEQLDYICFKLGNEIKEINIIHQNLKILSIISLGIRLIINCPNLKILRHDLFSEHCKIIHFNTIKYLSIKNDEYYSQISELLKFNNLEHIEFGYFIYFSDLNRLLQIPNLKIINLYDDYQFSKLSLNSNELNEIKKFLLYKKEKGRDDLILKLCGKKISNSKDLMNLESI